MRAGVGVRPRVLSIAKLPDLVGEALGRDYEARACDRSLAGVEPEFLAGVRALVTNGGVGAPADVMARLPALEIVAVSGVGLDAVDLPEAARRGVAVTSTPGILDADVADLAVAMMMALAREILPNDRFVREGRWLHGQGAVARRSLRRLRVGIFGLGRIGMAIARRCEPMTASVAYHNRSPRPDAPYAYVESLEALAAQVDVLMVAAAGGPASHGAVSARVIDALGQGLLINVARGSVVDEAALVAALTEGRLGGAGLDVFADEPRVPPALFDLPNVILQPHIGSGTLPTRQEMGELVLANLAAHFAGRPLLTPVAL